MEAAICLGIGILLGYGMALFPLRHQVEPKIELPKLKFKAFTKQKKKKPVVADDDRAVAIERQEWGSDA